MRPVVHFDGRADDGDAFFARCMQTAAALQQAGIGAGDVIALMLRNEPVLLEAMLAARWIGARWCLVNWHFKATEVRHILADSGARMLVVHSDLLASIREAIPDSVRVVVADPLEATRRAFELPRDASARSNDAQRWQAFRDAGAGPAPAQQTPGSAMVYTSGTTGLAKGIRREPATPEQLLLIAQRSRTVLGLEPGMRALISAPLYHSAPVSYVVQAALADAQIWIEPKFDAERTLQLIESERISHLYLVPTMYVRLLRLDEATRRRHDLSSVRFVASTGSACPPDIKRRMIDWWGPVFHEAYAASELGWISHIDSDEALHRPGSAGRALAGVQLKVLSEEGDELPAGSVGLLYARDPAVPDFTYANNDGARAGVERNGLWTLGDLGYVDDEGYLFVVDRRSDMVISGGVNIYPAEIEAALMAMPGVVDCAVFGIPDEEFGESLAAAVQVDPGAAIDDAAVRTFLRQRLAHFKVPRLLTFHEALPREETGKIFKRKLREPYWQGRARRV